MQNIMKAAIIGKGIDAIPRKPAFELCLSGYVHGYTFSIKLLLE